MKTISVSIMVMAFGVGLLGSLVAIFVTEGWADRGGAPPAMTKALEELYPEEFKSVLDIGSRFPDEVYLDADGAQSSFYTLFESGPSVLLFWSPGCPSCVDQANLWDSVMHPALLPDVQEVVCLPQHYLDSARVPLTVVDGKLVVYFDERRFDSLYNFIVVPSIYAVDRQGFVSAIQYEYSPYFTEDLIEAMTTYEVGPCIPLVTPKTEM